MKIAFWSNVSQRCGVSSNLAAVSVASVIRYPYTVAVFENHLCHNNLGRTFLGTPQVDMLHEVGTNYYEGGGIEGLLRKIYRGDYPKSILQTYIKEIIHKHLYYIPQSRVIHNEIFDYEMDYSIATLFQLLEEYADLCFIDTAAHNNMSTNTILEEADLIVVNLCQNTLILEDFFLNHSSLIEKAVFLIGNYSSQSTITMKKIMKLYEIPAGNIAAIPYNEIFQNAFHYGRLVEFVSRNYDCGRENPNYLFIQCVKKASHMIMKRTLEINDPNERMVSLCGR